MNDRFTTTHWSQVLAAGDRNSPDSRQALETLCKSYWHPLYAYARRRVNDVEQARDLTQAFFAVLLEKNYVGTAVPDRGRFRWFLLTSFQNFLSKQWEQAKAQKRGGGRAPLSLDFPSADVRYSIEPSGGLTAEQLYDRQWAVALLERTMELLRCEYVRAGKSEQFERLKDFMIGEHSAGTYAQVGMMLGMTEGAAKMAAHRIRRRYRQLLRQEIAQTVDNEDDVEDEIRSLFTTLDGCQP